MRCLVVFFFILTFQMSLFAQLSKVHYLPPVAYSNETGSNAIPNRGHYFYISTPSTATVTVDIEAVGGATTQIEVSNSTPYIFTIDNPGGIDSSQIAIGASSSDIVSNTSRIVTDRGYIVEATAAVYVALNSDGAKQKFLFSQINILLGGIINLNKKTESKKPVEEN